MQPGYLYTITTTTGQGKGTATSPAQGSLNLPYSDNFDSYAAGRLPKYLQDNQGAFETAACGGGRSGMCLRQSAPQAPITWKTLADPSTYGGNLNWNNYTVSGDVLLEKSGYVQLEGRVGSQNLDPVSAQNAYFLRVTDTGAWSILRNSTNGQLTTLRSGTTAALGTNRWHSLALGFSGSTITATIDGTTVGTVSDSTYRHRSGRLRHQPGRDRAVRQPQRRSGYGRRHGGLRCATSTPGGAWTSRAHHRRTARSWRCGTATVVLTSNGR